MHNYMYNINYHTSYTHILTIHITSSEVLEVDTHSYIEKYRDYASLNIQKKVLIYFSNLYLTFIDNTVLHALLAIVEQKEFLTIKFGKIISIARNILGMHSSPDCNELVRS